jgi:alcohol dehydrogenase class IV
MANKFTIPGITYLGAGALKSAESDICTLGKHAFIVTGKSMIKQGHIETLTKMLTQNNVMSYVFSEIIGEPTDTMIEAGLAKYKEQGCDFIIGFGGGSPLDSAKAIGAMVTNGGAISDYNGKVITKPIPPLVAIPSTAGTGSEVTQFTIISDTKKNIKMLLKGAVLLPTIAVIDPDFTMGSPSSVTAATGLDALTHAVESYTSKKAFEETDMYAISAVKRIFQYLPIAYRDGADKEAREQMSLAAYEAGICINNSSVTLVHGMSRPIGALFHVPHGISNAMLLNVCLTFALDGTYERFANLAKAIGVAGSEESEELAALKFLSAVKNICEVCEVPTLAQYGIEKEAFFKVIDKMAKDAFDSGSPSNTRKSTTIEDMKAMYEDLWEC